MSAKVPIPKLSITGTEIPPTEAAAWTHVLVPQSSNFAASGSSPIPAESATMRKTRLNGFISNPLRNKSAHYISLFSLAVQIISAHDALTRDLSVDLGCGDVGVPEHFLNRP